MKYNVIQKKSAELTKKDLEKMLFLVTDNTSRYVPNFTVTEDDINLWNDSIKNSDYYFILLYENQEVVGYLEYAFTDKNAYIAELELSDQCKGDNYSFKTLIEEFYYSIDNKYNIRCKIHKNNQKSQEVFTHIGMKKTGEKLYEMSYDDLEKYVESKKETKEYGKSCNYSRK